jgi:ribonuclease BN (tRNA processing enzyme)
MKFTFIGAGSAFSYHNGQSNVLVEIDVGLEVSRGMIDFGTQATLLLKDKFGWESNFVEMINWYYISHGHADHTGSIEQAAFTSRFNPKAKKPDMYGNAQVLKEGWDYTWKGGLASLEYAKLREEEQGKPITLENYFNTHYIGANGKFMIGEYEFRLVQTIHVVNDMSFMHSYGLFITTPFGYKVLFTSDTQFAPHQLTGLYTKADVIFHDCETTPFKSGVHAHYDDLKTLPPEIKSKLWLYHYNDGKLPDSKSDGFLGFVTKGQEFIFV